MPPFRSVSRVALSLLVIAALACPSLATAHGRSRAAVGPAVAQHVAPSCFGFELPAVPIPAVSAPAVTVPDQPLAGYLVTGFTIPALDIPADEVPAQCVAYDDVPVGCLSGVTIPGVTIPGITLAGFTIPAVGVPGVYRSPVTRIATTALAATRLGASTGTVCVRRERDGYRASIEQPSLARGVAFRPSVDRPSAFRPPVCVKGECLPSVSVPNVSAPSVTVPGVEIEARSLVPSRLPELRGSCAGVLRGTGETVIDLCADPLFARGTGRLSVTADRTLRRLLRVLGRRGAAAAVRVEGHTDDAGDARANKRLSLRRAQAVRRWLIVHGIAADRIVARGWGETYPTSPNHVRWGQAANRRVVVGVTVP